MADPDSADDAVVALLERTLAGRASTVGYGSDLADKARARHRQRSRRRSGMVAGAALAVAAVVATPVLLLDGSGERPDVADAGPSAVVERLPEQRPAAEGWRWEAYGDLQLLVPSSWVYGTSGTGCWSAERPHVGRPPSTEVVPLCLRTSAIERRVPFVWFEDTTETPPSDEGDGWVVETTSVGGEHLAVFSDDAGLRADILASVEIIPDGGTDAYGCPVTHPIATEPAWRPDPSGSPLDPASVSGAIICEYSQPFWDPGGLRVGQFLWSGRLPAAAAQAVTEAVPAGEPVSTDECEPAGPYGHAAVLLRIEHRDGVSDVAVRYQGCYLHGTDDGNTPRALTSALADALERSGVALAAETGARLRPVTDAVATAP